MKGLMIKDLMLMKNQKSFFIIIIVMAVCFSGTDMTSVFMVSYLTFLFTIFTVSLISYDEYENGYSYLFTLPIRRKEYVREKYCLGGILCFSSWCLGILLAIVPQMFRRSAVEMESAEWWISAAICLCVSLIFLSVMLPVRLKFEGEKGRLVLPIMAGAIFACIFLISKVGKSLHMNFFDSIVSKLMHMGNAAIAVTSLCVTVAFLVISYRISLAVLNKREF